jgi:hypothetical protein
VCCRSVAISGCLLLAEYRFGIPTVLRDGRSVLYDDKTSLGGAASTTDQAASHPWWLSSCQARYPACYRVEPLDGWDKGETGDSCAFLGRTVESCFSYAFKLNVACELRFATQVCGCQRHIRSGPALTR